MSLKPYPEYKDSGIDSLGAVPNEWHVLAIRRYVSFKNGADYKDVEIAAGGYPVIGSGGEFRRASTFMFDGESVLFGRKGTIDKPLYINGPFWTVDTMYYTQIDASNLLPRFLYYWALRVPYNYYVTSTALPSMTQTDLGSAKIALPDLNVQMQICAYLGRETAEIDAFIADQEELIALLNERRGATITQAVTKGLDPAVAMVDTGVEWLGDMPIQWTRSRLSRLGISQNSGTSVNGFSVSAEAGEIGVLKTGSASKGYFDPKENKRVVDEDLDRVTCPVKAETLLINRANTPELVGRAAYVDGEHPNLYLSDKLWQIDFTQASNRFVYWWSSSEPYKSQLQFHRVGASSTMQNLSYGDFKSFDIAIPNMGEQELISSHLDRETAEIDATIDNAREAIALSKERRAALISAAVTGKIDVRDDMASKQQLLEGELVVH